MSVTSQTVFDNISRHDYLNFKADDGIDYQSVIDFLEMDRNDVSKLAGISKSSVRYDERIPKELKDRLEEIANICQKVAEYFKGDVVKTALWFKASNPLLGNISPRDMIRIGRYKKLMKFIMEAQ